MPHTKSRYMQDLDFSDGRIGGGVGDFVATATAGSATLTRTAAGNINYLLANSTTAFFSCNVTNQVLRRTGFFEDLQENFGGAGIAGAAEYQGRPDTMGGMSKGQTITPRTAFKIKGFKLNYFDIFYTVTTLALVSAVSRVELTALVNGVAFSTTNIVPSAQNGLNLAFGANMNVITLTLSAAQLALIQPIPASGGPAGYLNAVDQQLWVEVSLVTGATGTANFYGFDFGVTYNFN